MSSDMYIRLADDTLIKFRIPILRKFEPGLQRKQICYKDCPQFRQGLKCDVALSSIREDIKQYSNINNKSLVGDPVMLQAIRLAFKAFGLPTRPKIMDLDEVSSKDLPIWTSSPGIPWSQKGYKTGGQVRVNVIAIRGIVGFWDRVKRGLPVYNIDCYAYVLPHLVSGSLRGDEIKGRAVWDYPITIIMGEAMFALPLIDAYSSGQFPIAYDFETGREGCEKLRHSISGNYYLGIKFSKFDKTVPAWLINVAFDILWSNFDAKSVGDQGEGVPSYIKRIWEYIKNYFVNTPIRICNGERFQKSNGIPSGSCFTKLIGSICNFILITYSSLILKNPITSIKVLGEDSIAGFKYPVSPSDIAQVLLPLGMVVNAEKSMCSQDFKEVFFYLF